jgi:hypothetical protein
MEKFFGVPSGAIVKVVCAMGKKKVVEHWFRWLKCTHVISEDECYCDTNKLYKTPQ